ncbi:MAG: hypothetical protein M1838_001614 [Thelocarpon superellum]|nr:MAG: hypothetical protein M1838_001614 [Thelocarpon superellum]
MSSMRNAVQRRNHRERAQPKEREKWGILEKHKDYSLRAKDYNAKKARLRTLRQKAGERNPDEFYFGMMRSRTSKASGTRIGDRGNTVLSQDSVRLLKTQDMGYLRTMAMKARKETEKLEGGVVLGKDGAEVQGKGRHVVFVDDAVQQKAYAREKDRHASGVSEEWRGNGDEADEHGKTDTDADAGADDRAERARHRLLAAQTRQKDIEAAERELDLQRAKMTRAPSVGGTNKHGVKWKIRERKK